MSTNSVLTNSSAAVALQNLTAINNKLTETQGRISTSLKVQGAKDNAAVWAVAQNQRGDLGAYGAVKTSLDRATSVADVSLAAGDTISGMLIELRQKATAAADPSASDATRKAYDDEFQALLKSIDSFAKNATFDGENILDGTKTDDLSFLANSKATESIIMKRQDFSLVGLALNAPPSLLTEAGAAAALTEIQTAQDTVTAGLAELGAQAKQIENHNKFVSRLSDALETGIGNLVDADLAKESARLQALQVQQQLGAQSLSIANQAPQIILSLFK